MRILLVGKGGRLHALAWKLSQPPLVEHVYVVHGNGGTARGLNKVSNIDDTEATNYPALVELATQLQFGLAAVGSDDAIVDGVEGFFREGSSSVLW